jgi:macrodomain Ter protein organizer (MatP/YcbG family)
MEKAKLKTIGVDADVWLKLKLMAVGQQKTLSQTISDLIESIEKESAKNGNGKKASREATERRDGSGD